MILDINTSITFAAFQAWDSHKSRNPASKGLNKFYGSPQTWSPLKKFSKKLMKMWFWSIYGINIQHSTHKPQLSFQHLSQRKTLLRKERTWHA